MTGRRGTAALYPVRMPAGPSPASEPKFLATVIDPLAREILEALEPRSGAPTDASIEAWLERTRTSVNRLSDRDGTFWGPKE